MKKKIDKMKFYPTMEVSEVPKGSKHVRIEYPAGGHFDVHLKRVDRGTVLYLGDNSPKSSEPIFKVNRYFRDKREARLYAQMVILYNFSQE